MVNQKMYLLLIMKLAVGILHHLPFATAIVVEDNTISYFKLPTVSVLSTLGCNTGKLSGSFILKCPRSAAGTSEPMKSCAIVNGKQFARQPVKPFWDLLNASQKVELQNKKQSEEGAVQELPFNGDVSKKSFQEHKHRRKGHSVKGYHNVYHRDEFVQDHIFYDDLDHSGRFSQHGKSLHSE